jgi:AcrR family transcriptional regulator
MGPRLVPAPETAMTAVLGPANLRQRALLCARARLEAHGPAGLNLRDIAADLGTGVASLYYHFANKDALLAELAIDGFRELRAMIGEALRNPRHRTAFHSCAETYVHFTRERPALYGQMYDARLLALHPAVREAEAAAFEAFTRAFDDFGVAPDKVADVALMFWTLGRGIGAMAQTAISEDEARVLTRRIADGVSAMIGEPLKYRRAES